MARARRQYWSPDLPVPAVRTGAGIRPVSGVVFACVLAAAVSLPVQAQDGDAGSLRQQVQVLTQRVERLEAEVHALQHAQPAAAAQAAPAVKAAPAGQEAPAVKAAPAGQEAPTVYQSLGAEAELRHAWHQLKRGMPASEVRKLLGPPSGQFRTGNITVWYYHYTGLGSGSVTISLDNKLSDWQPPSRGLF
ncbi:MAG: outer membrane protein assembly factor BamE [Gammaproteobacteria bacterium]|nr:outer membrane protein assembly factor BamE [Gammaproteobacteria bacterium]